jgi:hypothetical protein
MGYNRRLGKGMFGNNGLQANCMMLLIRKLKEKEKDKRGREKGKGRRRPSEHFSFCRSIKLYSGLFELFYSIYR